MSYRDRVLLTNPPPSAGGTLLAYALALLDRRPAPPSVQEVVTAMEAAQAERTAEFVEGLAEEGFLERFLAERLHGGGGVSGSTSAATSARRPTSRSSTGRAGPAA